MITGFNTDIDYEGVTYHVQTEDKGLATPLILSLVYDRGTILASKRSPYDDLLSAAGDFDEKVLTDRLQKQHKLICAAVRAGRIEDLKRMTMKESESRRQGLVAQKEVKSVVEKKEIAPPPLPSPPPSSLPPLPTDIRTDDIPLPSILKEKFQPVEMPVVGAGKEIALPESVWDIPLQIVEDPSIVEVVEEEIILPAEAVEIITDFAHAQTPAADNKLKIRLLTEAAFKGGERRTITMMVQRGTTAGEGLSGAQILVKIIGSAFRPLIFHAKTDSNGVATVHLQLPHFRAGRAAILIKAMSEGEETELRRVVHQG